MCPGKNHVLPVKDFIERLIGWGGGGFFFSSKGRSTESIRTKWHRPPRSQHPRLVDSIAAEVSNNSQTLSHRSPIGFAITRIRLTLESRLLS